MAKIVKNPFLLLFACCGMLQAAPTPDLFFAENRGQAEPRIRYMVRNSALTAAFAQDGVAMSVGGAKLSMRFRGAHAAPQIEGLEALAGKANFLLGGQPSQWIQGVSLFAGVAYRQLYPGIDLLYSGKEGQLKSEFLVAPQADPAVIRLQYEGASSIARGSDGSLLVTTASGAIREQAPAVYQQIGGRRVEVGAAYAIYADGSVGFSLQAYDKNYELTIDPVLSYSTLFGGSGLDAITAVALDSKGNIYIAGWTDSADFAAGTPLRPRGNGVDAFVAKLTPAGDKVLYCTYVGGDGDDRAFGIAVDAGGNAYVTGWTGSSDFPTKKAAQERLAGGRDAFLLKLNPAGNALLYGTYFGGDGYESGNGIALDGAGNAYIAGDTDSTNLPVVQPFQNASHGQTDVFAAKFSAAGTVVYATYLGGRGSDSGKGIAVDAAGNAYLTGSTFSPDFPVLNAVQPSPGGGQDAFVAKLGAGGNTLLFSTYLGGSGGTVGAPEAGAGIALDAAANVYVAGTTSSTNFPVVNALQASLAGGSDGFLAKLSASGQTLLYSTYFGGSGIDIAMGVAVDPSGNAYLAGYTGSTDLPTAAPAQASKMGRYDAFVAELSADGRTLKLSTYLGGSGNEAANAVTVDATGGVIVAGQTDAADFPVQSPLQAVNHGSLDAFVARLVPVVLRGSHDASNCSAITGYAWDPTQPGSTVNVDVYDGSTLLGSTPANLYRPDLGTGEAAYHGFSFPTPASLKDGNAHSIRVLYSLTSQPLAGTSQSLRCGTSQPVGVVSVDPASGSGYNAIFTMTYNDTNGYNDLTYAHLLVSSTGGGMGSCWIYYQTAGNSLWLVNDGQTALLGPVAFGANTSVENTQCLLNGAGSSVTRSGTALVVKAQTTFKASFAGTKQLYLLAQSASTPANWTQLGTWQVPSNQPPAVVSLAPTSGNGTAATFKAVYSDSDGYANITYAHLLVNAAVIGPGSCWIQYQPATHAFWLVNDAQSGLLGPVSAGSPATVENSQCILKAAESSAAGNGSSLTVTVSVSYKAAFAGAKNVYLLAQNSLAATQWATSGSWTVPSQILPGAVSITPSAGSGASALFRASYTRGFSDLADVHLLISSNGAGPGSCWVYFRLSDNTFWLVDDTQASSLGPLRPGATGMAENSQCMLDSAGSSVTISGGNVEMNARLNFKPSFSGPKNLFLIAMDTAGRSNGWQARGSWNVTAAQQPTTVISVTPATGSGPGAIFSASYSEINGSSYISYTNLLINSTLAGAGSCWVMYRHSDASLWLVNDDQTAYLGPVLAGSNSVVENTQCALSGLGSLVSEGGTVLIMTVNLTFKPGFAGPKKSYAIAQNLAGIWGDWQSAGSWTVTQ